MYVESCLACGSEYQCRPNNWTLSYEDSVQVLGLHWYSEARAKKDSTRVYSVKMFNASCALNN